MARRSLATASDQTVLILGSGLVARPCVEFLSRTRPVTLISAEAGQAEKLISTLPVGSQTVTPIHMDASDAEIERLVSEHDLTISLLPAPMHPVIARLCIKHKRNMVTASYVSPEMMELDADAKAAGITILNEVGVDPGMDHMSAMRVIDEVQENGGKIESFTSLCGGLPAPESALSNPLKYKFSWSPRGVLSAAGNTAQWIEVCGAVLAGWCYPLF